MENFTPLLSFIGGVCIGLAAIGFLFFSGRICGISGIFGGLLTAEKNDTAWRLFFLGGLMSGAVIMSFIRPDLMIISVDRTVLALVVAGLLVGVGVRLGNGCTSGHGVCGIGRMAPRSIVATFVFMTFGVLMAVIVNHVFGGMV